MPKSFVFKQQRDLFPLYQTLNVLHRLSCTAVFIFFIFSAKIKACTHKREKFALDSVAVVVAVSTLCVLGHRRRA